MPFHKNEMCGLVYLCEGLNNLRFYSPIPLVSVKVDAKVVNFTAQVEVTQEFVNREQNPIECVYFFPVEEEAAVVDFTAELEGRKIKTEIKEKEAAREEYNQAVQNRQTAFLLEETKPDIFEIKVGYLSPGAGCKIKMTYLSELPVEEGKTKLTNPTTVAPRYIPMSDGSPEATKIASIQHDFSSPVKMKLNLEVLMQTEIASIKSPSHVLAAPLKQKIGEYFEARTNFVGHTTNMDRDMVIYIDSAEPNKPKVFVEKNEEGSSLAMLSFVPEFKLKDHQVDAVFLVDCSGSMRGQSINLAKEALQVFLHSLPVNSFFNIIIFGSSFQSLFPQSRKYDDDSLKDAKDSAGGISANLGGTEIYQPLQDIFQKPLMAGHARQVFVLTDGQVSNSSACIDLVRKNSSNNRVFTLGIGSSADRHLVKGMARAGMGTAAFTTQGEPITAKVINQLKNALQPCISDVSVKWGKNNPLEGGSEVAVEILETKKTLFGYGKPKNQTDVKMLIKSQVPSKIPAIYDGSRLIAYKLLDESMDLNDEITVKAKTTEGELEVNLQICKDSFIHGNSLHQLCARKLIQEVEERHGQENVEESKKLITKVGLKYKVASKFTSFVGIDETQGNAGNFMITRHVRNQIPQNMGSRIGFGGFGSAPVSHFGAHGNMSSTSLFEGTQPPPLHGFMSAARGAFKSHGTKSSGSLFGGLSPAPSSFSFGAASAVPLFGGSQQQQPCQQQQCQQQCQQQQQQQQCQQQQQQQPQHQQSFSFGSSVNAFTPATVFGSMGSSFNQSDSLSSGSVNMAQENTHSQSDESSSSVLQLTMCQAANGSFPPSSVIGMTMGMTSEKVLEAGREISTDDTFSTIWMTIVVSMFLKEKRKEQKDIWDLVVEKAQRWLKASVDAASLGVLEHKAKEFISQINLAKEDARRSCPLGHLLTPMTQRDGDAWHCDSLTKCVGGCNQDGEHHHQSVWRCHQDWRVLSGGTCDFDLCGECVKQKAIF